MQRVFILLTFFGLVFGAPVHSGQKWRGSSVQLAKSEPKRRYSSPLYEPIPFAQNTRFSLGGQELDTVGVGEPISDDELKKRFTLTIEVRNKEPRPRYLAQLGSFFRREPVEPPEPAEVKKVPAVPLSQALKEGVTGLNFETNKREDFEKLQAKARVFVAYKKGKLKPEKKAELVAECLVRPKNNPFCTFLNDNWPLSFLSEGDNEDWEVKKAYGERDRRKQRKQRKKRRRVGAIKLKEELSNANLAALENISRGSFYRAMKRFDRWDRLDKVSNLILSSPRCVSVPLLTALGLKAEEYFPDDKMVDLVTRLYERSDRCGRPNSDAANLARYRAALLHVWKGRCAKADRILTPLSEDKEGLYISRALYWRAWCADKSGNKMKFTVLRNKLMKINPLGYHTLILNRGRVFEVVNLLYRDEPVVQFRSGRNERLDQVARSLDILASIKADRVIGKILRDLFDHLEDTDPEFRLYLAVLASRSNAPIMEFRFLAGVFREKTTLISRETLKMFFPLKQFNNLWRHRSRVDPYLVASLIRQESGFNPWAKSGAGALGLMQLMPATARMMMRVSRRRLIRPHINVSLGTRYLRRLVRRFKGDAELALAGYNAGPHNVDRWLKRYPTDNRLLFLDLIPFSETRNYVSLIGRNYYWYLSLYAPKKLSINSSRSPGRAIAASRRKIAFKAFSSF